MNTMIEYTNLDSMFVTSALPNPNVVYDNLHVKSELDTSYLDDYHRFDYGMSVPTTSAPPASDTSAAAAAPGRPPASAGVVKWKRESPAATSSSSSGSQKSHMKSSSPKDSAPSCLVCGEQVLYHNFGTLACNGCAAFFRRTILQRKTYICRQSRDCDIYMARHKRRCPYCRFERCVKVGMNVSKLMTRLSRDSDNPLKQLMQCHRGIYTARKRNAIIQLGNLSEFESMTDKPRTSKTLLTATTVEYTVMKEFLRNTNFILQEMHDTDYERQMLSTLLHTWLIVHSVFTTRVYAGHTNNKIYFVDSSYIKWNEDAITQYYSTNPELTDPNSIAISGMPLLHKVLDAAAIVERCSLDEYELVVLAMLAMTRAFSCRFGPTKQTSEWQNRLFRELNQFYKGIYVDMAKRLGDLMLCLEAIETADRHGDELAVIVQLNYRQTEGDAYRLYVRGHAWR